MSGDEFGVVFAAGLVVSGVLLLIGFLLKGERFTMYQEATGKTIEVKRGFSFTYYFFGPFVPLFRGHIGGFFLSLFIEIFTCGLARLILLFCYNGMYINWLAKNGFRRLGIDNPAQQGSAPVNIQINTGSGQAEVIQDSANEKYKETSTVMQPVNGIAELYDDEGATIALTSGTLVGISGIYEGAELPLNHGEKIIIGRDAGKSNLVIPDKEISRQHCEIEYDSYNRSYVLTDLSTNGIYLDNGTRLDAKEPQYIIPGVVIRIGNTNNVFKLK